MRHALISKSALLNNIKKIKNTVGDAKLLAYLKANAYGHGVDIVAPIIEPFVDGVAVSEVDSVYLLRKLNFNKQIILSSVVLSERLCLELAELKIDLVIFDMVQLKFIESIPADLAITIWLKINTGMNRLGISLSSADIAIAKLKSMVGVSNIILMTHCANAEVIEHPLTIKQSDLFINLVKKYNLESSFVNTAGVFNLKKMHLDWVRFGIGLYGLAPDNSLCVEIKGLLPVMQIKAEVISIQNLESGGFVGYGSFWQAKQKTKLAIVALGYADGVPVNLFNKKWFLVINNKKYPIVGKINMDMLAVVIDLDTEIKIGDWGFLCDNNQTIAQLANACSQTNYQIVTSIGSRVIRVLVD